ncbi:MAG: hypothetical protein ACRDJN_13350, partial [Chloroflexota bacterium]
MARSGLRRRRLLLGSALASGGLLAAACGPIGSPASSPSKSAGPATIQFWTTWGAQFQADGQRKVYEAFQQQAPEITVEMTHFGNQYDKIVSAVAAGTSPDVVTLSGGNVIQFARRSTIQALDD